MTLAVIVLSASIVLSPASPASMASQSPQSTAQDQASQNQGANPSQNPPASSQAPQNKAVHPQSSPTQKKSSSNSAKKSPTNGAHKDQKAKIEGVNCNPSAAVGSAGAENRKSSADLPRSTSAPSPQPSAPAGAGTIPASAPSTNCPPQKVIVPEGSTPEPSIQLAGGAADPPVRDNAKQLLQSTEDNLKKIEGQPLNSSQRDMVTQVRQFVAQSKKAAEEGDVESARTLAWKAQTLSQELVTPENK